MLTKITANLRQTYLDCARVLAHLGLYDADPKAKGMRGCAPEARSSCRMDANETMTFARSLEAIKTTLIEDKFPALKSKQIFPAEQGIDPGATAYTWRRLSRVGVFKFISARNASDLPTVEMYGTEVTTPIRTIGGQYGWTTEELRNTTMAGLAVQPKKAQMARDAFERKADSVIALGDTTRGIPGALTNSDIPLIVAGINGHWLTSATPQEMYDDLHTLANAVWLQSLQTFTPDTILLSPALWAKVSSTRMSEFDSRSVKEAFLASSAMIREVDFYLPCTDAAANGTDDRALVLVRNPAVAAYVENLPFQSLPPQAQGLRFAVPCEGKTGGCLVFQPYACGYCDVLN